MANYHDCCIVEVTDKDKVGMGIGKNSNGETRVCISLEGKEINLHLDPEWKKVNWISMNMECAKELHKLLDGYLERHKGARHKRAREVIK